MVIGFSDASEIELGPVIEGKSKLGLHFPVHVRLADAVGVQGAYQLKHLVFGRRQNAFKAAENCQWQDVVAVILGFHDGPEVLIGGVPDDRLVEVSGAQSGSSF
jgi:hypothetical protein